MTTTNVPLANVTEPVTNWTALLTNTFDGAGMLTITNPVEVTEPRRYFRIAQP